MHAAQVLFEQRASEVEGQSESPRHWTQAPPDEFVHRRVVKKRAQFVLDVHAAQVLFEQRASEVEGQSESPRHWTQVPPDEFVHRRVVEK